MSAKRALAAAPAATTEETVQAESNEVVGAGETIAEISSQHDAGETLLETAAETAEPVAEAVVGTAHPTAEREQAVARIRQSTLPPALRERLAAVVEAGQSTSLDVAACLEALEETLPDFLRANRQNLLQPAHPGGDAFFRGAEGELTDAEAEAIAQRQLARSGLLRGQRVKVAD